MYTSVGQGMLFKLLILNALSMESLKKLRHFKYVKTYILHRNNIKGAEQTIYILKGAALLKKTLSSTSYIFLIFLILNSKTELKFGGCLLVLVDSGLDCSVYNLESDI